MTRRFLVPLSTNHVDFNQSHPSTADVGRLLWDSSEGTLSFGLDGGNIDLPIGQKEFALCYNGTGSTLNKGEVIYINGAQGQRPSITKASASSESTSSKTFGVVAEQILNGAEGFVSTFGILRGLNTSSYAEGSALWLSTTAGQFTTTMPTAPNHSVFVGYCVRQHASSGEIFVKIQNGYELNELHNVSISSLQDGDILAYNSASGLWINEQPTEQSLVVSSGSSYPVSSLTNGQLFYNTTNGKTAIYFDTVWKEFAYATELSGIDGGLYSTTVFDNSIDGGSPTDTVFVGLYDGGTL